MAKPNDESSRKGGAVASLSAATVIEKQRAAPEGAKLPAAAGGAPTDPAHLSSADSNGHRVAALRTRTPTAYSDSSVEVDEEAGVIKNVAIMTIGPALGHGFDIDAISLQQLAELLNALPEGATSRFTHPGFEEGGVQEDDLPTKVGRIRNARVEGNCVRGDAYIGSYAAFLPGLGDVRKFLLTMAHEDPAQLGMSAVIAYETDPQLDSVGNVLSNPARIGEVRAVDFVGVPAANPKGLLSAKAAEPEAPVTPPKPIEVSKRPASAPAASTTSLSKKGSPMDEELKKLLIGAGCDPDASDDDAQNFYDGLAADVKSKIDVAKTKMAAKAAAKAAADLAARNNAANVAALALNGDEEVVKADKKRVDNIKALAANLKTGESDSDRAVEHAALSAIGEGLNVQQARVKVLAALSASLKPIPGARGSLEVGEDANVASLRIAIPQAICLRANPDTPLEKFEAFEKRELQDQVIPGKVYHGKLHERAFALRKMRITDMYKAYLRALGITGADDFSPVRLASIMGPRSLRQAFPKVAALAESTTDFANITLDAINKSLRYMYLDAPRTWNRWAQRQQNADFKNINRVVLSEAPSMIAGVEGKEINYVALSDSKETYNLVEYKAGIKLTRRAIVNDDMDAFNQIPRAQANSAARLEDDVAYAILNNNAAMADTGNLFNATAITTAGGHNNLVSSGTALSIASLQVMATLVKKQKGLAGAARLELVPKFLLVPTSIEEYARQTIQSQFQVASQSSSGSVPTTLGNNNPFYNRFEVIGSTRLDDTSATAWYLVADYRDGQINTVEVCFLTDEPEPVVRQETDFDTEDVKYAIPPHRGGQGD